MENASALSDHRRLAIDFNRRVWELFDNKARSPADADEMVVAAYASLAHWMKAGTGVSAQRGEWLIARVVYVELGRLEPARHHLDRTLALTERHRNDLADFDLAFAEALAARVAALAGDKAAAKRHLAKARDLGDGIADPGDRSAFFEQLREKPWFGVDL